MIKGIFKGVAILLLTLLGIGIALSWTKAWREKNAQPTGVPSQYASMYQQLETRLATTNATANARSAARAVPLTFGVELLTANAHRGEELLTESGYQGNLITLDRFGELGVGGVTLSLGYPLLEPDFPRSSEYLAFYKKLVAEIRRRNLKLLIKTGVLFNDPAFTKLSLNYADLTVDAYFEGRTREVQMIVKELAPDYLTIGNEPSTEAGIIGKPLTVERYTQYINDTLASVKPTPTLIGAGSGSWDELNYITTYAEGTALDYIDIHIYPLAGGTNDYLGRAAQMADIATTNGKRVIIGEFWLYKASESEVGRGAAAAAIFARDPFSFWAPLDQEMVTKITALARAHSIEYISPFWSSYFFAYIDYGTLKRLASAKQLTAEANQLAAKHIVDGTFSSTGLAYKRIIAGE